MKRIIAQAQKFFKEEDAASAIEYALLLAFLAVALMSALQTLRGNISASFNNVNNSLTGGSPGGGGGHPPPASPFM